MGHFIVQMSEMFRANFHPNHLTQVAQTTRDMLYCGMLSNTWQMFGMKLAQHPRKWVLLHPNQNVVERDTGHVKRLAIFVPNEFGQPSVHTNCSQHKCFPVACLFPEVQPWARGRTHFCSYVGRLQVITHSIEKPKMGCGNDVEKIKKNINKECQKIEIDGHCTE